MEKSNGLRDREVYDFRGVFTRGNQLSKAYNARGRIKPTETANIERFESSGKPTAEKGEGEKTKELDDGGLRGGTTSREIRQGSTKKLLSYIIPRLLGRPWAHGEKLRGGGILI